MRVGDIPLWLKVAQEVSNYYPFSKLILSAKEEELQYMQKYLDSLELNFILTKGGNTRQESLQNALMEVKEEYVLVSDIARCNTPQKVFQDILEQIKNFDCVVPFLSIPDTIAYADDKTLQYLKRENLKIIQTPQLSKTNILKQALQKGNFTDESSAISNFGGSIGFVQGSPKARKITFIDDLDSMQLPPPSTKTIIGNGSDIHALKAEMALFWVALAFHAILNLSHIAMGMSVCMLLAMLFWVALVLVILVSGSLIIIMLTKMQILRYC